MATLLAYHADKKIKAKYMARVKAHEKADEIIHGTYWENGKGCAVGCTVELGSGYGPHRAMEEELGIPRTIAYLEDRIFEGLPNGESIKFPAQFLSAITPGADLSLVTAEFMIWLLGDKKDGVMQYARPDGKKAIRGVIDLYKKVLKGKKVTSAEWEKARAAAAAAYAAAAADAAAAAAAAAAYAAAYAAADAAAAAADAAAYAAAAADAAAAAAADAAHAAAYAADAAAYAAADAAHAAAYAAYAAAYAAANAAAAADAAAYAAAWTRTRHGHYKKMAKKLLSLLRKAPVIKK